MRTRNLTVPKQDGEGKRAFVVGNGRSLTPDQLTRLHESGDVCFGMNRIHLIYGQTRWRPTYWILTDLDGKKVYVDDIPLHASQGYGCYVRTDILARCVVTWLRAIPDEEIMAFLSKVTPIDPVNKIDTETRTTREPWQDGLYNQGGSMSCALQLALAWGYNPIFVIGAEGNLRAGQPNHFSPQYSDHEHDDRNKMQIEAANEMLDICDLIALREYQARRREVYNASVGEVWRKKLPRADFWKLFETHPDS